MDEKTQRAFSRFFCSYNNYADLLNKIISGEPLTEIWGDYYEMSLEKWLQEKNIPKEDVINWLQKAVESEKVLSDKLKEANKLLAECESIASEACLTFSMPRVSGVSYGPSEWGVGWDRSDYSC